MRYCEDCKWLDAGKPEYAMCLHESASKVDGLTYVARGVGRQHYFAQTVRGSSLERDCGPEAKFFEPKEINA